MRKEKILVVCQHFWPEGFRLNDIAAFFVENGLDVEVLCGLPNYPKGELFPGYSLKGPFRENHDGVDVHRTLEVPRRGNTSASIFLNYISFPFFSLFHVPRMLFGKYDRIFLYQLSPVMMSLAGILVGKIRRIETTMYVLDLWPENLYSVINVKNKFLRRILEKVSHWHYRNVDKIVVLSDLMKDRLASVSGLPADKITVIPQACEKLYEEQIVDDSLASRFADGFKVVFAGNISPAQSFDTILEAAQLIRGEGIEDVQWVIVGDGMSRSAVEAKVRELGLSDSFHFEGQRPVEEVPRYTGIADALVGCLVTSDLLEATIPAKVLSYIASGKPLVLAMDGEVRKLVMDEARCGLVGPTEDAQDLANNVVKLYNMTSVERAALGESGRAYHFANLERNIVLGKLKNFILEA
ncbi:glycosyltransferase family 4 protein [Arthrobacter jiangjiafuii]|uniref:Glycosyltransferase family 4 protein n=2 Tax=Arthrobacter jiangjiafuii TaxID=2817475 RepID=A0A975M8E9_9MICC|nr:glycosyltransferase family 4 protein [Arthrobacter jiangjiafuii]QWC11812.1 glycosyltransferase family 4 protein [Arthrobacter jiangjiafuii]